MNKSELNLPLIFTWRDIFKTEAHSLIKYSIKKSEGQKEEKKAQFKGEYKILVRNFTLKLPCQFHNGILNENVCQICVAYFIVIAYYCTNLMLRSHN